MPSSRTNPYHRGGDFVPRAGGTTPAEPGLSGTFPTTRDTGEPDVLLAPDLEPANILAKQLSFLANADGAGLVPGARVPAVLTSRADSVRSEP